MYQATPVCSRCSGTGTCKAVRSGDKAKTLHHLGMVMRYRGDSGAAEALLREALSLDLVDSYQVSETLRELGRHRAPVSCVATDASEELRSIVVPASWDKSATV